MLEEMSLYTGWEGEATIVLDLDLYAKAYTLVHSRRDLRDRYVLCLGALHTVFAAIRAIGTSINCSGIDDAWMAAEWFDSECLLRQVKKCKKYEESSCSTRSNRYL